MNQRKRLAILFAAILFVAGIVGGLLADVAVSADGVVTVNGNRVWGGVAYVDELRATGSDGLKLYDDSGTAGVFVEDGGRVGVNIEASLLDDLHIVGTARLAHTSTEADDHALEIDVDAAGYGDVKALDIFYDTGAISGGEDEGVILINIDESDATGGDVFALEILATEG